MFDFPAHDNLLSRRSAPDCQRDVGNQDEDGPLS